MHSDPDQLLKKHPELTQSDGLKVSSHVQRECEDWYLNTIIMEGHDVPFKYRRKKLYKTLKGEMVNVTYYPANENVAGFDMETMRIVRIKIA